jgi:predicted CoA-substrate-specific enzyme activase
MITAGIDVGSLTTKIVLLKKNKVLARAITPTRADPSIAAELVMRSVLKKSGLSRKQIDYTISTGYGRRAIEFGDRVITEITANAKGAIWLGSPLGKIRTIIDLGGQDSKVIALGEKGEIIDFVMNDKCAAGTGRFLEVMARRLGVRLEDLGKLSLRSKNPIRINSTCTVFAESEVVSLIAQRKKKEDIIAGLHSAIAKRLAGMVKQVGVRGVIFFDGGGAKNVGIKKALEDELGKKVYVPKNPEFVIALGAALIAGEFLSSQELGQLQRLE